MWKILYAFRHGRLIIINDKTINTLRHNCVTLNARFVEVNDDVGIFITQFEFQCTVGFY